MCHHCLIHDCRCRGARMKVLARFGTALVLLLLMLEHGVTVAGELPIKSPAEAGFSAERLAQIDQYYQDKVNRSELAGIVLLVARHGYVVHFESIGYADTGTKQKM